MDATVKSSKCHSLRIIPVVALTTTAFILGVFFGSFGAKNIARSDVGNSYRALSEVVWSMHSAAKADDCGLLKRQANLVYERWQFIRFLPDDQFSPESIPEALATEIMNLK